MVESTSILRNHISLCEPKLLSDPVSCGEAGCFRVFLGFNSLRSTCPHPAVNLNFDLTNDLELPLNSSTCSESDASDNDVTYQVLDNSELMHEFFSDEQQVDNSTSQFNFADNALEFISKLPKMT